ncbi:hypothetical protein CgunFtcFv8_006306 [Champsocephalus gunnari]|uniref:SH3 domain-containing protein n=1 Tax=Champsocephalus gunnari TaxID=52237 RepID=A0AAN8GV68_CHAGU|nr:hypothetical protein CgunFtcFv8_006306 [Champsocephalus gunnari]
MSVSTVLAKALFDNAAESPEELAFRKGDILMVLEQEQGGGPGWWLCSLHGRQGIVPANRLRLLQTAPPPGSDPRRGSTEDSVYLSPVPPLARSAVSSSAEDLDGVYRSPPCAGEGRVAASRPGELRRVEAGRPRSQSSSGTRPRPDWDLGIGGTSALTLPQRTRHGNIRSTLSVSSQSHAFCSSHGFRVRVPRPHRTSKGCR